MLIAIMVNVIDPPFSKTDNLQNFQDDALFRKLIEHSYSGVTLLDKNLRIIYRSPSAERIVGWNLSDRSAISLETLTHSDDMELVQQTLKNVFLSYGEPIECTFRTRHHNGSYIWLECTFANMFHENDINAIVCHFKDVTLQKNEAKKLHHTLQELTAYKCALDESSIVAVTDQKGIIKHVNNKFCEISKYSRDELLGQDHRIINSGYHSKDFIRQLWITIAGGNTWKGEIKNKAKDGSYYWVDTTIVPFLNDAGKPYQYIAIRSDITERKLNQEQIIENSRFIKTVTDNVPAMIAYWTADLQCLFANKPMLDWFEMEQEEMLGIDKQALMTGDEFATYMPYIQNVLAGRPQSFERTFTKPNGNIIYTHTQYLPDRQKNGIVKGFYSLIYDASEIKLTARALQKQTEQVKYLLESITDGFIGLDNNLCYTYANRQVGKMLECNPEELIGRYIWEVFPDAVGSATYHAIQKAFAEKTFVCNEDYYEPLKLWQENRIYPIDNGLSIFIRDITKDKAERQHLKLLESVITNTTDAVIITEAYPLDEPGPRIIYINEAFTKMTGYQPEDIIGKTPRILQGPKSDGAELARLSSCIRNFETCEITTINYKRNGDEFWVNFSVSPVANDKGEYTHFISIERDITLQKKEALQKAQLSEAVTASLKERNTILESIGDAFFAVDKNWIVTYWNKIAEDILHTPKAGILNKNLWEVFADAVDTKSYINYQKAIKSRRPVHFEDHYQPFNKWYEVSAYPSNEGLSVYFKDITDRKTSEILLKTSEKKYSELFNLSPMPVWVFDVSTLNFLDVNAAAVKNYGYTREEFLSMTILDIRPADDAPLVHRAIDNAGKRKQRFVHQGIYRHQKKSGEIIKVDILSNTLSYKGKSAKVIIANDVTERLRYISAIESQNEKLREISWIQSHIVRSPLARIMGLAPLISEAKGLSDDTAIMLKYLLTSANELDDVIKTITDKTAKGDYNIDHN
ncbi:MAG: PAS domain S-box protein [Mucilaginibacter sp.]